MGLCPFHTFSSLRTCLADAPPPPYRHGLSLLRGWLPITIEIIAALVVVAAIGWRTRRWRLVWVPVAIVVGLAPCRVGALVRRLPGTGGRSRPRRAVDLDRPDGIRHRRGHPGLAEDRLVAARRLAWRRCRCAC